MATKKVKRFAEGGEGGEGFGYGEGAGAAQGAGMGGYGSSGVGYGNDGADLPPSLMSLSNISNASSRKSGLPAYDSIMLDQSLDPMRPSLAGHTSGLLTALQDSDGNVTRNAYGYQDAQQARDAYDSFAAEQNMRNESSVSDRAKGGMIKKYAKGGTVSASRRGDGIAPRGKTKGRMC